MLRLAFTIAFAFAFTFTALAVAIGCGADAADPTAADAGPNMPRADGSQPETDAAPLDAAKADVAIPDASEASAATGETCVGFATHEPCGAGSLPPYGYVCVNGSPPGIAGCMLASSSSFGDTYCCTENACVAQPDQDKICMDPKVPHRFQCPPEADGGPKAPPAGCVSAGPGGSNVESFFCCP